MGGLTHFGCVQLTGVAVTDLSPLKDMPLKTLTCDFVAARDAGVLRGLRTLETINDKPAAEFWKAVDAPPGD